MKETLVKKMLAAERHRKILSLVERQGSAKVTDLADSFAVTQETIRRDLERLESEGKLLRRRGGAINLSSHHRDTPFAERQIRNVQEKMAIAAEALRRIEPGDCILLDASTTSLQMAVQMPDLPVTVVTNGIKVVLEFAARPHVTCICVGGTLSTDSISFLGPVSESVLKEYHVDKLFLSCKGFDLKRGCSDNNELQAKLKHAMLSMSNKRYLLADHSKFGMKALSVFGSARDFDEIITDEKLDDSWRDHMKALQIPFTMARLGQ